MRQRSDSGSREIRDVLAEAWPVNEAINQLLIKHLDLEAWRAKAPGRNARTIAALFAHLHNIRLKWLRLSAPHLKRPAKLDRARCTRREASAALAESAQRCSEMLAEALSGSGGHARRFLRDGWAKPWPAGAAMVVYMISHEAHHRGQACMLAHQLGCPLPGKLTSEMWNWERLWKQCGFTHPR